MITWKQFGMIFWILIAIGCLVWGGYKEMSYWTGSILGADVAILSLCFIHDAMTK